MATKTRKDADADTSIELFTAAQPQNQEIMRNELLACLTSESVSSVRDKIGDAVAEIARQYSDNGMSTSRKNLCERGSMLIRNADEPWPDLLNTLSQLSDSSDAGQRACAFRVFATTPDVIQKAHESAVMAAFQKGFGDSETSVSISCFRGPGPQLTQCATKVRLSALEAFSAFFSLINKNLQKTYFGLIGSALAILPPVRAAKDDEDLTRALTSLIELAEAQPKMFKDHFHDLVTFSIGTIQDTDLGDMPRQNALELMATFADYHPAMCRKDPSYTTDMVKQCLALMTDVGVDDEDAKIWQESEDVGRRSM